MSVKILVADDDKDVVKLLALRLRANDFEVIEATDGIKAIARAHIENPDLILLDIMMPVSSGITVHKNLKLSNDTTAIPIIFITGHGSDDIRAMTLKLGAVDFITKPFDMDILIEKIKHILAEKIFNGNKGITEAS